MKIKQTYSPVFSILYVLMYLLVSCQTEDPSLEMKPLLNKYVEAWNTGNTEFLAEIVTRDFEIRMNPKFIPIKGIDSLFNQIKYWRTAYPDFHIEIKEEIFTKEKIAARWIITATNTGPGLFPPTGRKVHSPGMSILHISNGKLSDEWIMGDNLLWMQQLGYKLVPPNHEE